MPPNAGGFPVGDRDAAEVPRFGAAPCMTGCPEPPEVTRRAVDRKVTATGSGGRPAGTLPVLTSGRAAEAAPAPAPTLHGRRRARP